MVELIGIYLGFFNFLVVWLALAKPEKIFIVASSKHSEKGKTLGRVLCTLQRLPSLFVCLAVFPSIIIYKLRANFPRNSNKVSCLVAKFVDG